MEKSAAASMIKELVSRMGRIRSTQLHERRDKKLIDVAWLVGYESDTALRKAFKRVVGANTGEYIKRGFEAADFGMAGAS